MTKQSILVDNKKCTVSSAKIKKADPDVLAVRTDVFGQFNDIEFNKYFKASIRKTADSISEQRKLKKSLVFDENNYYYNEIQGPVI